MVGLAEIAVLERWRQKNQGFMVTLAAYQLKGPELLEALSPTLPQPHSVYLTNEEADIVIKFFPGAITELSMYKHLKGY